MTLPLRYTRESVFDLRCEEGLLDPDAPALVELLRPGSRVLWACDEGAAARLPELRRYLSAWQLRGAIEAFQIVEVETRELATPLRASLELVQAARALKLRRGDVFASYAGRRVTDLLRVTAASYRRGSRCVRVHHELDGAVHALDHRLASRLGPAEDRGHAELGLEEREGLCVVDCDALRSSLAHATSVGELALLRLAVVDAPLFAEVFAGPARRATRESGPRVVQALLRAAGTDWPGEPLLLGAPLVAACRQVLPLDPTIAETCAMVLATHLAEVLGLFPAPARRAVAAACWAAGLGACLTQMAASEALVAALRDLGARAPDAPLVLPTGIGAVEAVRRGEALADPVVRQALARLREPPQANGPLELELGAPTLTDVPRRRSVASAEPHSFAVEFTTDALAPANSALATWLRADQRVLAIVDAYAGNRGDALAAYLAQQRAAGRVAGVAIHRTHVAPEAKTSDAVLEVLARAAEEGITQRDVIVVMGGGTLMDVVGYAAAMHHGGTPYIRVPTTLLGQIDAGVGLKVGVNFGDKRNFIGAYYPPIHVLCDPGFFATLPLEELRCGLCEAIKIALVKDAALFERIEAHGTALLSHAPSEVADEVLARSVELMQEELGMNPYEHDVRRLPDFGHEFGHMLESLTGHALRHGEAVAIGMALSCHLAVSAGVLAEDELHRVLRLLLALELPIHHPACVPEVLWERLHDEVLAHKRGRLHLVVIRRVGVGDFLDELEDINPEMLAHACEDLARLAALHKAPCGASAPVWEERRVE